MEPVHKLALTRARQWIVRDLDVPSLLDCWLANEVIRQAEAVYDRGRTREENARYVLDLLPQNGPKAFDVFTRHLAKDQYWLNDLLTKNS